MKILFPEDTGTYMCVVENAFGKANYSVEVVETPSGKTIGPPPVKDIKRKFMAMLGKDLNITLQATVSGKAISFGLIRHHNLDQSPVKLSNEVVNIPRVLKLIGPNRKYRFSNLRDSYRYQVTFMFKDLKRVDFGFYSMAAGSPSGGYNVYVFGILEIPKE